MSHLVQDRHLLSRLKRVKHDHARLIRLTQVHTNGDHVMKVANSCENQLGFIGVECSVSL